MLFISWSFVLPLLQTIAIRPRRLAPTSDQHAIDGMDAPVFEFSPAWSILGPFQIGTREAAWGADPLEYYGGFSSLEPSTAQFKSSLTYNGTATWSVLQAKSIENTNSGAKISLSVNFTNVDWNFMQTVYGWSALQYQAWARGEVLVNAEQEQTVSLYTNQVLEYAVDGIRHFGGDFYAFRKAPILLHLAPGKHVLDIRLVRDVRAMGGIGPPVLDVDLELKAATGDLELGNDRILVSDVVNGNIASPYGSVTVRNNGKDWIEIVGMRDSGLRNETTMRFLNKGMRTIAPGQTRPVTFQIKTENINGTAPIPDAPITIKYRSTSQEGPLRELAFKLKLERRSMYEPHRVTHLHPGGIVSYAMIRPPSANASCPDEASISAPILLQFHGAGVEADNGIVAHSLDPLPNLCAWVVYPTGVTPWSADDWHNWGFADVEAAVAALPDWIRAVEWKGIGVDTNKWLVSGHSNGGQGSWYALTHRPDKIFAAAPVSGYLSIHGYVPYQFWRTMDPRRRAVIEASANSYRHELLASNAKGIPIYQQHGSADDNVPAYHSRLMSQLLSETGWPSEYSELPGKGHWFETVMTTDGLQKFYTSQLKNPTLPSKNLTEFDLVVPNPGDTASKSGVSVLYLEDPGLLGKIRVSVNEPRTTWSFETANVIAFEIEERNTQIVAIDGQEIVLTRLNNLDNRLTFFKGSDETWKLRSPDPNLRQRSQLGGIDAILRSNGSFNIAYHGPETFDIALQISRNLHQYFSADAEILDGSLPSEGSPGNVITVALGNSPPLASRSAIQIVDSKLLLRKKNGEMEEIGANEKDLGAIFVGTLENGSLMLTVWGRSRKGLAQAARLAPLTTGIGQPDFVILEGSSKWKGVEGTSLGFFDASWNISPSSVLSWSSHKAI